MHLYDENLYCQTYSQDKYYTHTQKKKKTYMEEMEQRDHINLWRKPAKANIPASQRGCQSASQQHASCLLLFSCTGFTSQTITDPLLNINNVLLSSVTWDR